MKCEVAVDIGAGGGVGDLLVGVEVDSGVDVFSSEEGEDEEEVEVEGSDEADWVASDPSEVIASSD